MRAWLILVFCALGSSALYARRANAWVCETTSPAKDWESCTTQGHLLGEANAPAKATLWTFPPGGSCTTTNPAASGAKAPQGEGGFTKNAFVQVSAWNLNRPSPTRTISKTMEIKYDADSTMQFRQTFKCTSGTCAPADDKVYKGKIGPMAQCFNRCGAVYSGTRGNGKVHYDLSGSTKCTNSGTNPSLRCAFWNYIRNVRRGGGTAGWKADRTSAKMSNCPSPESCQRAKDNNNKCKAYMIGDYCASQDYGDKTIACPADCSNPTDAEKQC